MRDSVLKYRSMEVDEQDGSVSIVADLRFKSRYTDKIMNATNEYDGTELRVYSGVPKEATLVFITSASNPVKDLMNIDGLWAAVFRSYRVIEVEGIVGTKYTNNKNKTLYKVIDIAISTRIEDLGHIYVIYESVENGKVYARQYSEFKEKFTKEG